MEYGEEAEVREANWILLSSSKSGIGQFENLLLDVAFPQQTSSPSRFSDRLSRVKLVVL